MPASPAIAAATPALKTGPLRRTFESPKHLVLWFFILIELFPLYMMFQVSFKDNATFLAQPWLPLAPHKWNWDNWAFAINLITPYLANTIFVAVTATFCTLFLAILGAYFFARKKLPFSGILWAAFLFLMIMPGVANIVTVFMLLKSMNLLNTLWALIILAAAGGQVFNIFVLRHFIEDLPKDLFEAAEMDGASHLQQILNVVIPMAAPIIGTLAILSFLGTWNDFMMPLVILRDRDLFTLGVGLIYLDGEYVKPWGRIMASYFLAAIPLIIIFLFTMRLFVRGLSAGAIKG